jgi:hypothetical protein
MPDPNVDRPSASIYILIDMMGKIRDLLLRPDIFFRERMKEAEELKLSGLIAIVGGVMVAAAAYVVSGTYAEMFSGVAGGMGPVIGIIGAVSAFFVFIIFDWIIFSALFYGISIAFAGKGTFKRTLEFTGLGLVPIIIGSVISLLIALYYIPLIEVPIISGISDPIVLQEAIREVMQDPAFREFTQVSSLISVIFLVWSANLWIFAMKHARNLPMKHAVLTVLIPVVIYAIFILVTAFTGITPPGGI